jgi:hypothetical protein
MENANRFTVSIDDTTGEYQFLLSNLSACLLDETSNVRRASHVEPVNRLARLCFYLARRTFGDTGRVANLTRRYPGLWRVNLAPIDGPVLPGVYSIRSEAIQAEVSYLEENFL